MNPKKIFFSYMLLTANIIFLQPKVDAACNFKTANFIEELNNPSLINDIDIYVKKSKNYTVNLIKALLSSSTSRLAIDPKYKKKFNAEINVNYDFGTCFHKGKVWQNGDFKDHLEYRKGLIRRSLNVKLDDGNIFNATKFKLLIPRTRNGRNEILASLIFRNIGFIAPETFEVIVNINDQKSKMIFQEDSQKEMLERNNKREGPIFEGDESLMWGVKQYEVNGSIGGGGLEKLQLSRLINRNWFLKGNNSQLITLNSFFRLQNAYLEYANEFIEEGHYIAPNKRLNQDFSDYSLLMLAMNASHGLRPHNRKYYFNSFTDYFEPIYYDGDGKFDLNYDDSLNFISKLKFDKNYKFNYLKKLKKPEFFIALKKDFESRIQKKSYEEYDMNGNLISEKFNIRKSFDSFIKNIEYILSEIRKRDDFAISSKRPTKDRNVFLDTNKKFNIEKYIVKDFQRKNNNFILDLENGTQKKLDIVEFSKLISRKKIKQDLYTFIPVSNKYKNKDELVTESIPESKAKIIYPKGVVVEYDSSGQNKKISIFQNNPSDSVLIKGGKLENYLINFIGSKNNQFGNSNEQRFNKRGLTGCLNIYDSNLKDIAIKVNDGRCEDSLNIIDSKGYISSINVDNGYQDAIDLDFSDIKIKNIKVENAGNDCLDVSGGNYYIQQVSFKNCGDKAISIGEKSDFFANEVFVEDSLIGVAIKDSSRFLNNKSFFSNTPTCAEIFKKKQEFNGALANFKEIKCDGTYYVDDQSILIKD